MYNTSVRNVINICHDKNHLTAKVARMYFAEKKTITQTV